MLSRLLFFCCVIAALSADAQERVRPYEFGTTVLTLNYENNDSDEAPDRPAVQLLNGIFFRYAYNRLAFRAQLSYSEYSSSWKTKAYEYDGTAGDKTSRDLRLGAGVQGSILKEKDWLYAFTDLCYRNVFSEAHIYGSPYLGNGKWTEAANGFDGFLGLGIKLCHRNILCLSVEGGSLLTGKLVNVGTIPLHGQAATRYTYSEVYLKPFGKLHLTVKF